MLKVRPLVGRLLKYRPEQSVVQVVRNSVTGAGNMRPVAFAGGLKLTGRSATGERLREAPLDDVAGECGAAGESEPLVDFGQVGGHRPRADAEFGGKLLARESVGDVTSLLDLALAQRDVVGASFSCV